MKNIKVTLSLGGMILVLAFMLFAVCTFLINAYKLTQCDYESPWKCEAVHALGLFIPPLSLITVWSDDDTQTR